MVMPKASNPPIMENCICMESSKDEYIVGILRKNIGLIFLSNNRNGEIAEDYLNRLKSQIMMNFSARWRFIILCSAGT